MIRDRIDAGARTGQWPGRVLLNTTGDGGVQQALGGTISEI